MFIKKNANNKIFSLKIAKKILCFLIFVLFFDFFLFPIPALASEDLKEAVIEQSYATISSNKSLDNDFINKLPNNDDSKIAWSGYFTVSAYNSEVGQCDDTPCITANGFNLCEHGIEDTVATNMLPFGTKIRMPEYFGDKVFLVRDRMHKRYTDRFDVWMLEKQDARQFGVKVVEIEILEP